MSDGGKGSAPRPLSVDNNTFADNWAATFGKKHVDANDTSEECVDETDETEHDEDDALDYCDACSGSGEGMYDGSSCYKCHGSGVEPVEREDDV